MSRTLSTTVNYLIDAEFLKKSELFWQVFAGFMVANLSDRFTKKLGL